MMNRRDAFSLIGAVWSGLASAATTVHVSTLPDRDAYAAIAEAVLRQAYLRLGIGLVVDFMPGERSLVQANSGRTDGELYRRAGIERNYPNLIMVPVPIMHIDIVAFSKDKRLVVKDWESLRPYRLAYVRGIKIIEENTVGMSVSPVLSTRNAFSMIDIGRVDVVLALRAAGLEAIEALHLTGIGEHAPALASFPVYHYLNRKHADLLPALSAVLHQMAQDETISRIAREKIGALPAAPGLDK
jgi:polar amino acid transport system substrate-binding protein